jgi:hypothetical protein
MAVYLIAYDLKRGAPLYNYTKLREKIESFGEAIKILDSTFVVDTQLSSKFMSDEIMKIYQPEFHIVIELKLGSTGTAVLKKEHHDWINRHL